MAQSGIGRCPALRTRMIDAHGGDRLVRVNRCACSQDGGRYSRRIAMKYLRCSAAALAVSLVIIRTACAETTEQKVTAFLLGTAEGTEAKTELFYTKVKDNFTTKITFTA